MIGLKDGLSDYIFYYSNSIKFLHSFATLLYLINHFTKTLGLGQKIGYLRWSAAVWWWCRRWCAAVGAFCATSHPCGVARTTRPTVHLVTPSYRPLARVRGISVTAVRVPSLSPNVSVGSTNREKQTWVKN